MDAKEAIVNAAIALNDTMGFEVRGLFARIDCHRNRLDDLKTAIEDFRTINPEHRDPAHDIAGKVRAETMQLLADGLRKFAPDLAEEIIVRWKSALPDEWIRLERFLDVMKDES